MLEEVYPKCIADLKEHVGVDRTLREDIVNVGSLAVDFAGEPGWSAFLPNHLLFYQSISKIKT